MSTLADHQMGRCTLKVPHHHYPQWLMFNDSIVIWLAMEFASPKRKVRRAA